MQEEGIDVEMRKVSFLPFSWSAPPPISHLCEPLQHFMQCLFFFAFLILLSLLRQMKIEGAHLRLIMAPRQVQNALHTGWLEVEYTVETSASRQTSANLSDLQFNISLNYCV